MEAKVRAFKENQRENEVLRKCKSRHLDFEKHGNFLNFALGYPFKQFIAVERALFSAILKNVLILSMNHKTPAAIKQVKAVFKSNNMHIFKFKDVESTDFETILNALLF